jgi:hypothetical protein
LCLSIKEGKDVARRRARKKKTKQTGCVLIMTQGEGMAKQRDKT